MNVLVVKPTQRLSGRVIDLEVKGLRVGALDNCDVVTGPFIGFSERVCPPVGPVYLSSVHGDSKRVGQILMTSQHLNQPRAVVLRRVDCVRPEGIAEKSGPSIIIIIIFLCLIKETEDHLW